jgi:hypothetical protein
MNIAPEIARQFKEVYFGGNWTAVNLKDTLADVSREEATTKVFGLNTIGTLVHHTNYYLVVVSKMLRGEPLQGKDALSFDHPPIASETDWQKLLENTWKQAENFSDLIAQVPDTKLEEDFYQGKYGNYYRNFHGIIEHVHYHLGQIVLIKKIIRQPNLQG